MTYKMYLMSISGLEEESLQQDAMCLLDSSRKELVQKYKKEKDRMRAIVAGLLLQVGFFELEPAGVFPEKRQVIESTELPVGQCYVLESKELIAYLKEYLGMQSKIFPIELKYQKSNQGKPFWDKELLREKLEEEIWKKKKLWHFNLSHSGDYVVLAVADVAVGVDIQEAREVKRFPGGYNAFSRMEAFVKCTGEGYAKGINTYKEADGNVSGYQFEEFTFINGYAMHLCLKK